jgi:hypothetical protein
MGYKRGRRPVGLQNLDGKELNHFGANMQRIFGYGRIPFAAHAFGKFM